MRSGHFEDARVQVEGELRPFIDDMAAMKGMEGGCGAAMKSTEGSCGGDMKGMEGGCGAAMASAPQDPHAGHGGAMTLRAAVFDAKGKQAESELDASTCDCCQTDSVMTPKGLLLAYRDRADGEIRDIATTRFDGSRWSAPTIVHADGWFMPACPVNGPAIAARGRAAWVAWFTAAGNVPALKLAASADSGDTFGTPRTIARGEQVQGRVDLAADASGTWLAWVEEADGRQSLWLARFDHGLRAEHWRLKVADLAGRGRIDAFFLSGGQIDGQANINLVGTGDYPSTEVRWSGSFGSAYLYFMVPRVILFRWEHSRRTLVRQVDFISAPGRSEPGVHRPGGPVALFLFLFGLTGLICWVVLRAMLIGESIPGAWHWLLLIWSIVAVTLALRLRKRASINWLGAVWLVGGIISTMLLLADPGTYFT